MWKNDRSAEAPGRLENLKELIRSHGGVRVAALLPRTCRAGHGRRAERRARRRLDHDAAFGQGPGIRDRVPARLGGRPVPAPARARRRRPLRPGGRAPPRLCRPDPRQEEPAHLVRLQPPHPRPVAIDHPLALPRRTAGGACRGRRRRQFLRRLRLVLWRRRLRSARGRQNPYGASRFDNVGTPSGGFASRGDHAAARAQ